MSDSYPVLYGADGIPCAHCAGPLAADQRYCLACGARRTEAPAPSASGAIGTYLVPYGEVPAGPVAAAAPRLPARRHGFDDHLRRAAPLLGLAGVLLLSMLIGVLLGHWAAQDTATAQAPPQVISVGAAAPAPTAATTPTTTTATTPAVEAEAPSGSDTAGGEDDAGSSSSSGSTPAATKKEAAAPEAPPAPKELSSIDELSGDARQDAVDALPKKVSTGGKAPPKDDKPAAAGGDFEDIG